MSKNKLHFQNSTEEKSRLYSSENTVSNNNIMSHNVYIRNTDSNFNINIVLIGMEV